MTWAHLSIDLPLFLIRVVIVSFFSIGFIQFFQRLWNKAFDKKDISQNKRWTARILLTLITAGLGTLVHLDAMFFIHNNSAIIYHNWALFILILPLLFGGFSKIETGIQILALIEIWYMHHATNFFQVVPLVAFVIFLAATIALKIYHKKIMKNWGIGTLGAIFISSIFWFTVPKQSMGMTFTLEWKIQAVILYTLMITFVLGYWIRQYQEDQRKRQLERLADYERGIEHNSYADHQTELQKMFSDAKQSKTNLSFATFDLDNMKLINNRFGRLAGNEVLSGVSRMMKQILNNSNLEYQLFLTSGEEYNIVFPNNEVETVLPIVKACWQGIRKSEFAYNDRNISVTTSVGLTTIHSEDTTVNNIYKRADDALLRSKQYGRDTITLDKKIVSGIQKQTKKLSDYCYFAQDIYDVSKTKPSLYYHELLLRTYDSNQKRWILPDYFEIPVWMQITLLKEFMSNTEIQNFNLNLTAKQFEDIDVAEALTQFAKSSEGPNKLTIEITDLKDSQTTRRISALYRSADIKIMIDDVGSDNSFELVRGALPYVNDMKFAMQNLRKTNSEKELAERVAFWNQIAQEQNLDFILEGVETETDLLMAKKLGVSCVQGYFFGKPAPNNK